MKLLSIIEGVGVGALAMYFFDPKMGRTRRTMLEDQTQAMLRRKQRALRVMEMDLKNRTQGFACELRSRFGHREADDQTLTQRIRSISGRYLSHPQAISVQCTGGDVVLQGQALAEEVRGLVRAVCALPGVDRVENNIVAHTSAKGIPELQGSGVPPLTPGRWSPGASLLGVAAGAGLALYGLAKGGLVGLLIGSAGVGLVSKGFHDTEARNEPARGATGSSPVPEATEGSALAGTPA